MLETVFPLLKPFSFLDEVCFVPTLTTLAHYLVDRVLPFDDVRRRLFGVAEAVLLFAVAFLLPVEDLRVCAVCLLVDFVLPFDNARRCVFGVAETVPLFVVALGLRIEADCLLTEGAAFKRFLLCFLDV